jgi:putative oxidoreductase
MRRLFSTFARGWPGVGLLLLRLVVGIALIGRAVEKLNSEPSFQATVLCVLAVGLGLLLFVGLWTPLAGTLVAGIQACEILWKVADPWTYVFVGTIGAALAMLGPGFWSVDARMYGWKRIDLPSRKG